MLLIHIRAAGLQFEKTTLSYVEYLVRVALVVRIICLGADPENAGTTFNGGAQQ